MENQNQKQEYTVDGAELYKKMKELIQELLKKNQACRLIVKNEEGKVLMEIPLAAGALFTVFAPLLVGFGAMGALLGKCSITVTFPKSEEAENKA